VERSQHIIEWWQHPYIRFHHQHNCCFFALGRSLSAKKAWGPELQIIFFLSFQVCQDTFKPTHTLHTFKRWRVELKELKTIILQRTFFFLAHPPTHPPTTLEISSPPGPSTRSRQPSCSQLPQMGSEFNCFIGFKCISLSDRAFDRQASVFQIQVFN
jgi:hypothetical protein